MDVMRSKPRELTEAERRDLAEVKELGERFVRRLAQIGAIPGSPPDQMANRELSLAKTKLEEAVMWASKGISA